MRNVLALALASMALLAGCETDLPQATEIARMRVLGVRFDVVGDEERTTPEPGESLSAALPVVFPTVTETTADVETLWIGCTGPDRYTGGMPICQEFIDAAMQSGSLTASFPTGESETFGCDRVYGMERALEILLPGALSIRCTRGDPATEFRIPEGFTAENFLFLGVVCERGRAQIDPSDPLLFTCAGAEGGEAIRFHGLAPVQYEADQENDNPSLAPLEIKRENVLWEPYVKRTGDDVPPEEQDVPPEVGCETWTRPEPPPGPDGEIPDVPDPKADPQFHSVVPGAHRILLRYRADERQIFDGEPEALEFTVYTTLGEMERRFTLFPSDDQGEDGWLESELDWDPPRPSDVPPAGQLVRFFITLRDQRGGFAITERALCLR